METCIYMAESIRCSPENITTLLVGYTPVQDKKFKKRERIIGRMISLLGFPGLSVCRTWDCRSHTEARSKGGPHGRGEGFQDITEPLNSTWAPPYLLMSQYVRYYYLCSLLILPLCLGSSVFCNWKNSNTQYITKIDTEFSMAVLRISIQLNAIQIK